MIRRILLVLAAVLPAFVAASPRAFAQSTDSCLPNYAHISRMQGLLHWNHFPLRIAIVPPPEDVPDKDVYVQAVLAGFSQWVEATHGFVRYTLVAPSAQADVTVSFCSEANVPGQGAAVGYTSMVFCGTSLHCADMCLATGGTTPYDLQAVAAHEFGHALGIDGHSDDSGDIMYPSTLRISSEDGTPVMQPPHPITVRDLNTLKLCYAGLLPSHVASRPEASRWHGHSGAALLGTHPKASR